MPRALGGKLGHQALPLDLNLSDDDYKKDVDTSKIVLEAPPAELLNMPDCDKFRILIIGKAGVGKSTICSRVFGIPPQQAGVSHYSVGTSRESVWHPITFRGANENLILHDSGGFEAGDLGCMAEITKFINFRKTQHHLSDQLHCIWYCISCNSNRPIQEAELEFFRNTDVGNIPVVVVFTQFDKLAESAFMKELRRQESSGVAQPDLNNIRRLAYHAAVDEYDRNYRGQFERTFGRRNRIAFVRVGIGSDDSNAVQDVDDLINETRDILLQDGLKLLWTVAQAHSADMKLQASMELGMRAFWMTVGVGSIPFVPFVGATAFHRSFIKILARVNTVWRIPGYDALIQIPKNRNLILQACFDTSVAERIGVQFLMALNFLGPLTSADTAMVLLKLVAGISLLYESFFWEHKKHPEMLVNQAVFERLTYDFRKSQGRSRMSNHLTARITVGNAYNKDACLRELRAAVELGRNETGKRLVRSRTAVAED